MMTSMSPQNSQRIWRQGPHGGVGDCVSATTAIRENSRMPSDTALKIAGRSAHSGSPGAARHTSEACMGAAEASVLAPGDDTVQFEGEASDWGYRRLVLHFAHLAVAAGGVDAITLGSELKGLTTLRDDTGAFPFVEALCDLAGDVREVVGPDTAITYGADWSEYFGHQPQDGSGDVLFHLDPLWAHPEIGAVGIDNYMPLSDWRDDDYMGVNPDGVSGPYDLGALLQSITGGEGFDWFYPDLAARLARARTPITDGACEKPWTFRYKDLQSWWSQLHFDRPGGVEQATPTAWVPYSKPIWFTELGSAAVDKGPNQPNVFPDPKSIESAIPFFSSGGRADLAQRRFFEAHALRWDPEGAQFDDSYNPVSPVYGGRMLDFSRSYLWAWDARPFPAFPLLSGSWSDGDNWHNGHWLNGRFGNPLVGDLINDTLADHGLPPANVSRTDGTVVGYVIENPASARSGLEPICNLFGISCREDGGSLTFAKDEYLGANAIELTEFVSDGSQPVMEIRRTPDHDLPVEAVLTFRDPLVDYQAVTVRQRRFGAAGSRQHALVFPGTLEREQGKALLADWLKRAWNEREQATFSIAGPRDDVVPGALVKLPASGNTSEFLITQVEDGLARKVVANEVFRSAPTPWLSSNPAEAAEPVPTLFGRPLALLLDLPFGLGEDLARNLLRVAAWQKPWKSQQVFSSPETTGFIAKTTLPRPANVGIVVEALPDGVEGRTEPRDKHARGAVGRSPVERQPGATAQRCEHGRGPIGSWRMGNRAVRAGGGDRAECLEAQQTASRATRDRRCHGCGRDRRRSLRGSGRRRQARRTDGRRGGPVAELARRGIGRRLLGRPLYPDCRWRRPEGIDAAVPRPCARANRGRKSRPELDSSKPGRCRQLVFSGDSPG